MTCLQPCAGEPGVQWRPRAEPVTTRPPTRLARIIPGAVGLLLAAAMMWLFVAIASPWAGILLILALFIGTLSLGSMIEQGLSDE